MEKDKLLDIEGSKGGGGGSTYVPREDPNTLRSKATARVIDLLCEGEIQGLVDGNESIYLNEVPLYDGATPNFSGVTVWTRNGTPDQDHIPRFSSVESEIGVNTELKYGAPLIRNINDADIDDVRVTLQFPTLLTQTDRGDLVATSVQVKISIAPQSSGVYVEEVTLTISGKCTSEYQRSYLVGDLTATYGAGPWYIKVERLTADSDSAKLQNATWWLTYTTIINEKLIYPDTALVGCEIDSEQFGDSIPNRAYRIQGLKIKYPNNYTPGADPHYVGTWNGTFTTGYCNNPAWVYYDLLTNTRYGAGIDESYIDKYGLYTIARYCDAVDANGDFEGVDDGFGGKEVRFSFNGVIQTREEAYKVISYLASTFRSFPIFTNSLVTAIQDIPTDPTRVVTNVNVVDGLFTYEGSSLKTRNTVVNVAWNDLDDFGRIAIETYYDADSIVTYGYKPIDITAFGCTSRGQAKRIGKWTLDTQLNATETVRYTAGWDHIDAIPGEVIQVADNHYAAERFGGRVVSCTTTQMVIDNAVTIDAGETYTLAFQTPAATLKEVTLTNVPETTDTLTFAAIDSTDVAEPYAVWVISASNLATRQFRIVSNREIEAGKYEIIALLYDPNKYARVEEGIIFDEAPTSRLPDGVLIAPTDLNVELYDYVEGQNQVHKWGVLISWIHSSDPRKLYYQIQVKETDTGWYDIGTTPNNSFDWKPNILYTDYFSFRVRTVGVGGFSAWVTITNQHLVAVPDSTGVELITGLQVRGGGDEFDGPDCEIEWDDATSTTFNEYRIEVYKIDDTLLRVEYTKVPYYTYFLEYNKTDTSGTPIRQIKFKVYIVNVYGQISPYAATLVASNPIPSMAGTTPTVTDVYAGLKIDWSAITPADNDLLKYVVYCDTNNPPTTVITEVGAETTYWIEFDLTVASTYRVQIEPYDKFGAGTKSSVQTGEPLQIPAEAIDDELLNRMEITDSSGTIATDIDVLYDRVKTTGGLEYNNGDWIHYNFPTLTLQDRVAVYANKSFNCYVSYSEDNATWYYLKAEADHTLDSSGRLLAASNEADAITNYWTANAGDGNPNVALLPNRLLAKHMKLHILTNTTTIYELIFVDQIIAEAIVTASLSAISANIGTVVAGMVQSSDGQTYFDLDNDVLVVKDEADVVRVKIGKLT